MGTVSIPIDAKGAHSTSYEKRLIQAGRRPEKSRKLIIVGPLLRIMGECKDGGDHVPEDIELDEEVQCLLAVCSKCGKNINSKSEHLRSLRERLH